MDFDLLSYLPALPLFILLIGGVIVLLLESLLAETTSRTIIYATALLTSISSALASIYVCPSHTVYLFNHMLVIDQLTCLLQIAMSSAVTLVFVYSRALLQAKKLWRGEYFMLSLFALLGMQVMVSSSHFLSLYLGLEVLALSLYALIALQRDSLLATEASMKYFILGALASGLLLYGMSMLYGATGSLDLVTVAANTGKNPTLFSFGLVFVVAGLMFKLGVVPFHMWVPDVYEGAPMPMTAFIAAAPKIAAFAFVLRILEQGAGAHVQEWQGMLVFVAILSLLLGNIVAIAQTSLKRMLAYSTISHMGFLALALATGSQEGYSAGVFYAITYALTASLTFGILLYLSSAEKECQSLSDLKGLSQRSPLLALLLALAAFSMAGIPSAVGFTAKFLVLSALLTQGQVWLAVFAVVCSLIGAFYYLRMVKLMYFDAPVTETPLLQISSHPITLLCLSMNGLLLFLLFVFPSSLIEWCKQAIEMALAVA